MTGGQSAGARLADPADVFGGQAAGESIDLARVQGQEALALQQEWMDYIQGMYEPFSDVAEQALTAQVGLSGLGGAEQQQQMVSDIQADPFYQAQVGVGEEAVLRNQAMTGGLRSGTTQEALAQTNQALLSREIDTRYQRLAGLSGQGFAGSEAMGRYGTANIDQMSTTMGGIASGALATGAAAQARGTGLMSGIIGGVTDMFSDERLKTNITKLGTKHGLPLYQWDWNETAENKFDLHGKSTGHMVSDVELKYPELVGERDGYKTVNYGGFN